MHIISEGKWIKCEPNPPHCDNLGTPCWLADDCKPEHNDCEYQHPPLAYLKKSGGKRWTTKDEIYFLNNAGKVLAETNPFKYLGAACGDRYIILSLYRSANKHRTNWGTINKEAVFRELDKILKQEGITEYEI